MSCTSLRLGASELVRKQGQVLVYDGGQVDQRGLGPQHALCRERRLMMPGLAHHQVSRNPTEYKETWVSSLISSFFLKLYFEFLLMILLIS